MPSLPRGYEPIPYAGAPRSVPNYGTLGELMGLKARSSQQGWMQLASAFDRFVQTRRAQEAAQLERADLQQQRQASEALKRDEMAQRKAEREEAQRLRDEAAEEKKQLANEKRGDARAKAIGYGPMHEADVDTVMQSPERAGDVRYSFGPGTADGPELQPTQDQQRTMALEKAVREAGGTVGPNGSAHYPPKPPAPPAPPNIGSFEDYVTTKYGPRPTPTQIEQARRTYGDTGRAEPRGLGASLNLPGAYGSAFSRAILNAAPMKRAGLIQTANDIAAGGTEDDLKSLIRQAAIEGENVDVKNQILGRQATIRALSDAKKLITDMKAQGVPTSLLSGTMENVARNLGKTTNPQYIRLAQNLQDALINYRRAATGAAFSDSESKAYASMFPAYTNDLPVNVALLDGLTEAMSSRDNAYWEYKLGPEGAALVAVKAPAKKNPYR